MNSECKTGILVIQGNKTYGRHEKSGKLLYRCVPNDKIIGPSVLIPYNITSGFNKYMANLYVEFSKTSDNNIGTLIRTIGPVTNPQHFYEYQVSCFNLNQQMSAFRKTIYQSMKANNISDSTMQSTIKSKYPTMQDRSGSVYTFTIDPANCEDFDDAISIESDDDVTVLSIHISNVALWLDLFGCWDMMTKNNTSSVYLPTFVVHMLPAILSTNIASLKSGHATMALTLDITICNITQTVVGHSLTNCIICVNDNYAYDAIDLDYCIPYNQTLDACQILHKFKNLSFDKCPSTSKNMIEYLMMYMNQYCAEELFSINKGIMRKTVPRSSYISNKHIPSLYDTTGVYVKTSLNKKDNVHSQFGVQYTHITSPIRRLVDIINSIQLQEHVIGQPMSIDSHVFYDVWSSDVGVNEINEKHKIIKRVENKCQLLHLVSTNPMGVYSGYCVNVSQPNDNIEKYIKTIYLPGINMFVDCTVVDGENHNIDESKPRNYNIIVFDNEDTLHKKLRLQGV